MWNESFTKKKGNWLAGKEPTHSWCTPSMDAEGISLFDRYYEKRPHRIYIYIYISF